MSKKTLKNKKTTKMSQSSDLEKVIMGKIKSDEIKMKPKWLFVLGSILTLLGTVGLTMGAVFFANLTIFLVRKKGPGYGRLELMFSSFPLWVPVFAVVGIVLGIWLLRKYDFSYKKNFTLVVIFFIASIVIAAFVMDQLGLNAIWSSRGPMKGFYGQFNNQQNITPRGRVQGRKHQ